MPAPRIHVVAGVLFDASGRVLVAQRPEGTHLAGRWELPGGKLGPGESREVGLARELSEELGIRVLAACPLILVEHRYPDRDVVLDVWSVGSYSGEPHGREGQPVEWRDVRSLDAADFPPADAPVLTALRLPRRYLVTPEPPRRDWNAFLDRLAARVDQGFDLVQLRAKSLEEPALIELGRRVAEVCRRGGATLLVNADPGIAWRCGADGVHLTARRLARMLREPPAPDVRPSPSSGPPAQALRRAALPAAAADRDAGMDGVSRGAADGRRFLAAASCHDADDLERARAAGCEFSVLGPVRATTTHPGAPALQWDGFERLAQGAGLPVFAIGGLGEGDVAAARRNGGQGVAAIRAFWEEA